MEPTAGAAATSPPPTAPPSSSTSPPPPPAAPAGGQSSGSGSGTPGVTPQPGTTPAGGTPGFTAGASPATQAAAAVQPVQPQTLNFESEFSRRYGMSPDQAQMLMSIGYRHSAGQPGQGQPTQPAPTQPQTPANPFGLPTFDTNLLNHVARDPATGQLVNLPGAPIDAAFQVAKYQEQLKAVQTQFWQNPQQYLAPLIAAEAKKIAGEVYQQQFGGYKSQETATQILQQNADWLYARDASGQPQQQFDPATGQNRQVLSAYGRFYAQQVQQIAKAGVSDPQMQHTLAVQALQNALFVQQQAAAKAGQQGAAAGQQFLQGQAAASVPPPPANVPPPTPAPGESLRDRMRRQFEGNGLTDQVVLNQIANRAG